MHQLIWLAEVCTISIIEKCPSMTMDVTIGYRRSTCNTPKTCSNKGLFGVQYRPLWDPWKSNGALVQFYPRARWISKNNGVSFNSSVPGRSRWDFNNAIFDLALLIEIFRSSYDTVLRWLSQDLTHCFRQWLVAVRQQAITSMLNQIYVVIWHH